MIFHPDLIVNVVEPVQPSPSTPSSYVTHYVGHQNYPLVTSSCSSVFEAHYSDSSDLQQFSGPVKRLTFLQLGSLEAPNLLPYASTCENVDFNGHIVDPSTAFKVIHQLGKVSSVTFFIGSTQQLSSSLDLLPKTMVCSSVQKLKIVMDLQYFYTKCHECSSAQRTRKEDCLSQKQYSLVAFVESILKQAAKSFPHLNNLIVELPENRRLCRAVQTLIDGCPELRTKLQTSIQCVPAYSGPQVFHGNFDGCLTPLFWTELTSFNSDQWMLALYQSQPQQPKIFLHPAEDKIYGFEASMTMCHEPFQYQEPMLPPSHRPPPGFAPLPHLVPNATNMAELKKSTVHQDVHQRVNNWLRTLEM